MSAPPSSLHEVIIGALAPYIGDNMARTSVRMHCAKLHIHPADLRPEHVDEIVAALAPGLNVFVGRDKTAQISTAIRRAAGTGSSS